MAGIHTQSFEMPPVRYEEILRYAGIGSETPELKALAEDCIKEALDKFVYRVCWAEFPVKHAVEALDLGFAVTNSKDLQKNLTGCGRVILFAATVGLEIDRLIRRYTALDPARAVMLQALGVERIESLCDAFNGQIAAQRDTKPRYSPGYGDLPLALQRDVMAALDCTRKIGITLGENLLMSPSKSVTALIGIKE